MNAARLSRVAAERHITLGRGLTQLGKIAFVQAWVFVAALVVLSGGAQRVLADDKPAVKNSAFEKNSATEKPAEKSVAKPAARNGAADTAAEEASLDKVQLESVLVVFESSGKLVAMRVVKEHQIAVLQACFPDFHVRPKSDAVVKWAPKYEIYFNFQDGRTIRVLVSGNSRYWTTGAGELEMRGMYFSGVIHELLKANMKSGDE